MEAWCLHGLPSFPAPILFPELGEGWGLEQVPGLSEYWQV